MSTTQPQHGGPLRFVQENNTEKVLTIFFVVIIPLTSEEKLHTVEKLTRRRAAPFKARITEWRDFSSAISDVAVGCQKYRHTQIARNNSATTTFVETWARSDK
jgi:hypothetical protein